jgi:hypothetical protein
VELKLKMGLLLAALQEAKLLSGVHIPVMPQMHKVRRRSSSSGEKLNQNLEDEVLVVEGDTDAKSIHEKPPVGGAGRYLDERVVVEDRPDGSPRIRERVVIEDRSIRERSKSPHEKLTTEER